MNALGLPVGWMTLFEDRDFPVYTQVVLPAFILLGLHILFVAVRDTLRWRRFGLLEMTLDPLPGAIGGTGRIARVGEGNAPEVGAFRRGNPAPIHLEVPDGLPPTEEPSDDYHKWVVRV